MKPVFASFGEAVLRLAPPGFERLLQSPTLLASFGGPEANVAIALAQLGTAARFITILPETNPLADAFLGELRRFDVDATHVVRASGRMGISFVEAGANQTVANELPDRAYSALAEAKPGTIDWRTALEGVSWFHMTGLTPAVSASAAEMAIESLRKARELGIRTSCDLQSNKHLWTWGKKECEVMPQILKLADICIANEEDCQQALSIHVDIEVESCSLEREKYSELTGRIFAMYPNLKTVAMFRNSMSGSNPGWSACLHTGKEVLLSAEYEIRHVIQEAGSRDAFAAGLIYGLTQFGSMAETLDFAVAAATLKCSFAGEFSRFTASEIQAMAEGAASVEVVSRETGPASL